MNAAQVNMAPDKQSSWIAQLLVNLIGCILAENLNMNWHRVLINDIKGIDDKVIIYKNEFRGPCSTILPGRQESAGLVA